MGAAGGFLKYLLLAATVLLASMLPASPAAPACRGVTPAPEAAVVACVVPSEGRATLSADTAASPCVDERACAHGAGSATLAADADGVRYDAAQNAFLCPATSRAVCSDVAAQASGPVPLACRLDVSGQSTSSDEVSPCNGIPIAEPVYFARGAVAMIVWVKCPTSQDNCGYYLPAPGWSCSGSVGAVTSTVLCQPRAPTSQFRCARLSVFASVQASGFDVLEGRVSCGVSSVGCNAVYGSQGSRCTAKGSAARDSATVRCEMTHYNYYHGTSGRTTCSAL